MKKVFKKVESIPIPWNPSKFLESTPHSMDSIWIMLRRVKYSFFWHCKCVEIMLFGVIFKEQNAKNKKKAGDKKNLLPNISTLGALENITEIDLGSYSAGLSFSLFFYHFG